MNWLSKKFLIKGIKRYFHIEDQQKINVSLKLINIFGKHQIQQMVNSPSSFVLVQSCQIKKLQLVFDSSKQEPLMINVAGVTLRLKFNKKIQAKQAQKKNRPEIDEFKKMIAEQNVYEKMAYFEKSPLKQIIIETLFSKLSLSISEIDVSVQYQYGQTSRYFGFYVGEINIKQKVVLSKIKKQSDSKNLTEIQQVQCGLKDVGLYLGVSIDQKVTKKQSFHKEIISTQKSIKKKFILLKNYINIFYNQNNNSVSVIAENMEFDFSNLYINELLNIVNAIMPLFSTKPKLKPGQGKKLKYMDKREVSQGTVAWWNYIGQNIVSKIKQKQQFNIISNKKYRLYMYCLLYRYTFGTKKQYEQIIESYEYFKNSQAIMNNHKTILQKIYRIQNSSNKDSQLQLRAFVQFLCGISFNSSSAKAKSKVENIIMQNQLKHSTPGSLKKIQLEHKLKAMTFKKIKYEDIKKSDIFTNFANCLKFIEQYKFQLSNSMNFLIMIKNFRINLINTKEDHLFLNEVHKSHPKLYHMGKKHLIDKFYLQNIKSQVVKQYDLSVFCLDIKNISFELNGRFMEVGVQHIRFKDTNDKLRILQSDHLKVSQQVIQRYSEKQNKIVLDQNEMNIRISKFYFNATLKFVKHILILVNMITEQWRPNEQQIQEDFLKAFINRKIPKDRVFNIYANQSLIIHISSLIIATSVFDKDRIFQMSLTKIQYIAPINQKKIISLQKIQVKRTTLQNLKQDNWKKLSNTQSVILQNDRAFTAFISEGSKTSLDVNIVFNLVIPFLFIRISCQDIYYFMTISKYWSQLFSNQYLFKPKPIKKDPLYGIHVNRVYNKESHIVKFVKKMKTIVKYHCQTSLKLDGLQLIFNADNPMSQEQDIYDINRILTVMVQSIEYHSHQKLLIDKDVFIIKNIYVKNCLGQKTINLDALDDIIQDQLEKRSPLIMHNNQKPIQNFMDLIMYNHFIEEFEKVDKIPFLQVTIIQEMKVQQLKRSKKIQIQVKAFQIFHQPEFFRIVVQIFNRLSILSVKNFSEEKQKHFMNFNTTNYEEKQFDSLPKTQSRQILYQQDFSVTTSMDIHIQKVNFIVMLKYQPVLCIALSDTHIDHKTQLYVSNFYINIKQLYIMDISKSAGPHQSIIETSQKNGSISINFTQYNCEILKQRYKKSALMKINIPNLQINFLNKKIMELVNFIMQLKEDILGKPDPVPPQQSKNSNQPVSYPFCYQIKLVDSQLNLYRNSLSKQKLKSSIGNLIVTNFKSKSIGDQNFKRKTMHFNVNKTKGKSSIQSPSFLEQISKEDIKIAQKQQKKSQQNLNETVYQDLSEILQDDFKSFTEEDAMESDKNNVIFIDLKDFIINGRNRDRNILTCEEMFITFQDINLGVTIPQMLLDIDSDDFRLLIRLTQQNLGEPDILFHVDQKPLAQKRQKFISKYQIQALRMACFKGDFGLYAKNVPFRKRQKLISQNDRLPESNILTIIDLKGKNTIYTNGEKLDQISIQQIFSEHDNMTPFLYRSKKHENSPQLFVRNHNIKSSMSIFEDYKNKFNLYDKDKKQKDPNNVSESQNMQTDRDFNLQSDRDDSKCQKLLKWISGMCDKCLCCIKKKQDQIQPQTLLRKTLQHELLLRTQRNLMIKQHTLLCTGDLNATHIVDQDQIIKFLKTLNPEKFYSLYKKSPQIYLNIVSQVTRQKKLYMLIKQFSMVYEKQGGLLDLAAFFGRPYCQKKDLDPQFLQSHFNNFRPFQMYIQVKESQLQMTKQIVNSRTSKIQETQKIIVSLQAIYNVQNTGDIGKGPGSSIKQADVVMQMFYCVQKGPQTQYVKLSNQMQLIYNNNSFIPYLRQKQVVSEERMIFLPYESRNGSSLQLYLPAFHIKSLAQIYANTSKPVQKKQIQTQIKQPQNKCINLEKIQTKKRIFVPDICINIDAKIKTSFLKIMCKNLMFINNYQKWCNSQTNKMQLYNQISINYWNLNLAQFQPFLQPWSFKLSLKVVKRQNTESKKMKVEDYKPQQNQKKKLKYSNNSQIQRNWLNINLTTSFIHTYKELQLKYQQAKDQKEEQCIDLTLDELQKIIAPNKKQMESPFIRFSNMGSPKQVSRLPSGCTRQFPSDMKNFFGRRFRLEQITKWKKKGSQKKQAAYFHQQGVHYCLYHSFFDHQKRRKIINYRTPFRILNNSNIDLNLFCRIRQQKDQLNEMQFYNWDITLFKGEYYSLPKIVYKTDFVINFDHLHKNKNKNHGEGFIKLHTQELPEQKKYVSSQYIMQVYSQISEFKKIHEGKLYTKLFSIDQDIERFLDVRDILVTFQSYSLVVVCTKSKFFYAKNQKQKNHNTPVYDTLVALVSPIQVFNDSPISFSLLLNNKKVHKIPSKKTSHINQDFDINYICDTIVEFQQHILHRQFCFFKNQLGSHVYCIEIDRMQSVNLKVIRQTLSTCNIEIYADWIIQNYTTQEFQLQYNHKFFPIDQKSKSCIAIQNYQHGYKIQMKFNIYSNKNQKKYPYKLVTNGGQLTQIIQMFKKIDNYQILQKKRQLINQKSCCCFKKSEVQQETQEKASNQIYEVHEFVLKIDQKQTQKRSKTLAIRYKNCIRNQSSKTLKLFQYSQNFQILTIFNGEQKNVWGYDFLPQHYFIQKQTLHSEDDDKPIEQLSQGFMFDPSYGKSITLKFKKLRQTGVDGEYYRNFDYLKIDIEQNDHACIFVFKDIQVDSQDQRHSFPIYIHNITDQNIKIFENNQQFVVRPNTKVPFSWSDLIHNTHQLGVQIAQIKKVYSFKQNIEFQPIIITQEQIDREVMKNANIMEPTTNFHKQVCKLKYGYLQGKFEMIIDIKQNQLIIIIDDHGGSYKFDMKQVLKMTTSAQSIQLWMSKKQGVLQFNPSPQTYQTWLTYLNYSINYHIAMKIFFTIQTNKNSRLFFFHNLQIGRQSDYKTSTQSYSIQNLFISLINTKPEEVMLIHAGDIRYTQEDRICKLGYQNYQIQKCEKKIEVKEIKICNQLENAVNPVVLTQIKKSKFPFLSIQAKKQNLVQSNEQLTDFTFKDELITHYKYTIFFLDQAEAMIQASLFPKVFEMKTYADKIQQQYRFGIQQEDVSKIEASKIDANKNNSYQLYLNFLQIKPIKMTISLSFDQLTQEQQKQRQNFNLMNLLPVGVQNAIITIDSYMFHHIFEEQEQVRKQIKQSYTSEVTKQILFNAGTFEFLAAIDLVKGLGIGVKNIFYDPFYQLASNKQLKTATSTLVQGIFSLFVFLFSFLVKLVNFLFKMLAALTLDGDYKAKRQIFRKQIFKSPLDGVIFGGKYLWKIFKSFFQDFLRLPKKYSKNYSVLGCLFGFILAILNIVPWVIKIMVGIYDFFYVIGIGFLSWGHYEENAMRHRSRPIRVFHKKLLRPYNLLQAKAYEIMRKNNISLSQNQQILFVRDVQDEQKTQNYLILSDYRLIYSDNKLNLFDQIILYKIKSFKVIYPQKKARKKIYILQINLKSSNKRKIIIVQLQKFEYKIQFTSRGQLEQVLDRLNQLKTKVQFQIQIQKNMMANPLMKQLGQNQSKMKARSKAYYDQTINNQNYQNYQNNQMILDQVIKEPEIRVNGQLNRQY